MLLFFVLVLVVVLFWNANSNSSSKILDGVESYSILPTIKILPVFNKYHNAQKLTTTTTTRIPLIPVTIQLLSVSSSSSSSLSAAQKDQEEEQSQEQEEQTGVLLDDENGEDGIDLVATNNAILSSEEIQKQENYINSIRNGYSGMPSSGYSRSLYGTDTRPTDSDDIDEDGYGEHTRGNGDRKSPSILKRTVKFPIKLVQALVRRIQLKEKKQEKPGTLILVRHGESTWNANKTFTGYVKYSRVFDRMHICSVITFFHFELLLIHILRNGRILFCCCNLHRWADPDLTLQGKREMVCSLEIH